MVNNFIIPRADLLKAVLGEYQAEAGQNPANPQPPMDQLKILDRLKEAAKNGTLQKGVIGFPTAPGEPSSSVLSYHDPKIPLVITPKMLMEFLACITYEDEVNADESHVIIWNDVPPQVRANFEEQAAMMFLEWFLFQKDNWNGGK